MNYLEQLARRIRAQVSEDIVPDGEDTWPLFLIYAALARSTGAAVTPADVHDAWVAWMTMKGESHESMREFAELDRDVQAEDNPFVVAIRRAVADSDSDSDSDS